MDNRIRQIEVRDHSLVPAEADVRITVTPEYPSPTLELRGRLMGPRCPYASTVEVAYHLRPLPPGQSLPSPRLTMRAVIPEASFWEPESPFLYQGPIELWQDGRCCDRVALSHGFRSFQLGEKGLRINGRARALRGRAVTDCSDAEALALRQAGYNLLVAPVAKDAVSLWERADRLGFLVLGRIRDDNEATRQLAWELGRHASCLGWLFEEEPYPPAVWLPPSGLVGLACGSPPRVSSLSAHFLFGPAELASLGKPLLVTDKVSPPPPSAVILGSVL